MRSTNLLKTEGPFFTPKGRRRYLYAPHGVANEQMSEDLAVKGMALNADDMSKELKMADPAKRASVVSTAGMGYASKTVFAFNLRKSVANLIFPFFFFTATGWCS